MANGADFSFLKKLGIGGSDPTQGGTVGNPMATIGQVGYINPGGAEYAPSGYKDLIADPSIEGYRPNYKKRKRYT
jgi:hypothetical protein